jgi:hypothetical protein
VLLAVTVVCLVVGLRLLLRGGRVPSSRVPAMSWWIVPSPGIQTGCTRTRLPSVMIVS